MFINDEEKKYLYKPEEIELNHKFLQDIFELAYEDDHARKSVLIDPEIHDER